MHKSNTDSTKVMILIIMMEMLHNIQIDQPASTHIDPDADEQDISIY